MLVAARRGLPVALHTPSEVKAAITGSGRAAKGQVGAMVTRILRLDETPTPADAADALALAICHVWRGAAVSRLQAAAAAARTRTGSGAVIAQLTGTVLQVGPTSAVIEVGGFGVLALCSPDTTATLRVGERTTLATSLVVREDSLTLYGFAEPRRAGVLRTAADRHRSGPEAGAGGAGRAHARTSCGARSRPRTSCS